MDKQPGLSNCRVPPCNAPGKKEPALFFPSPCHQQEFLPSLFHADNLTIGIRPPGKVEVYFASDRVVEYYLSSQSPEAADTSLPIEQRVLFRPGFHITHPPRLNGNAKVSANLFFPLLPGITMNIS